MVRPCATTSAFSASATYTIACGHACVHKMILNLTPAEISALIQLRLGWRGQADAHLVADILAGNQARRRRESNPLGIDAAQRMDEPREATRAVAAHLGLAAIGVIITHAEIGIRLVRRLGREQAIGANPKMPVAKPGDLFRRKRVMERAIVDHDKVVPAPLILTKGRLSMGRVIVPASRAHAKSRGSRETTSPSASPTQAYSPPHGNRSFATTPRQRRPGLDHPEISPKSESRIG